MTEKTIYIAKDNRRFDDKAKCEQYEADGCVEYFPLPKYGIHRPLNDADLGWMMSGDGSCYYATADRYTHISPRRGKHPAWATHLVYFGK